MMSKELGDYSKMRTDVTPTGGLKFQKVGGRLESVVARRPEMRIRVNIAITAHTTFTTVDGYAP